MKRLLLAVVVMLMAMTTIAVSNAPPADALEQTCFIDNNRDEVCVRVTAKGLCISINGVSQGCEVVDEPTSGPTGRDMPCAFLDRGCSMFDAVQVSTMSTRTATGSPGWHAPGTGYVLCEFVVDGCGMWESGVVLAQL